MPMGSFTGATPEVTVMVHSSDADRARDLIRSHQTAPTVDSAG